MASSKPHGICRLSPFEKRLYCSKKRVSKECLKPWFLGRRCPYLEMGKLELIRVARKGVREVVALGGFSKEAIEYAERYRPDLKLVDGSTTLKPRRRKIAAQTA